MNSWSSWFWCVIGLLSFVAHSCISNNSTETRTVAFYHIFAQGPYYRSIVDEQIRHLNDSGVLRYLQSVQYVTVGSESESYTINHEKFVKVKSFQKGYEDVTLDILHKYCQKTSHSNVLYFHPKSSFHHNGDNENLRKLIQHYSINTECIHALKTYDTCGARFTILPNPRYIANMWSARCSYINTLVSPLAMAENYTLSNFTKSIFSDKAFEGKAWFAGLERYFSEHWLSTGIEMNPADCMNFDKKWVLGYKAPRFDSLNQTNEVHCDKALFLAEPMFCREAYQNIPLIYKKARPELYIKRSRVLYGKEPTSLINWYRNCNLLGSHVSDFRQPTSPAAS